jgi:hypothetical protein
MPKQDKIEKQSAWDRAYDYALDRGNTEKAARHYADNNDELHEDPATAPTVDPDEAATNRANSLKAQHQAEAIRDAHAEGDGEVESKTMVGGPSRGQAPLTQTREQQIAEAREVLRRYGAAE